MSTHELQHTTESCDEPTYGAVSDHEPLGATRSDGKPLGATGSSQERPQAFVRPWTVLQRVHGREKARIELVYGRLPAGGAR
jgi:hypothetical protein